MEQLKNKKVRYLTGITTSGTPHLGNYVGSIRPSIQASCRTGAESFYFLADYHALIKTADPKRVAQSTLEIAASWLACGLDPEQVFFYRQSDIPEITQLCWFLTCVAGKGMLNRAHAYKAAMDKNIELHKEPDSDVTAGLFMYPVLMAADILMFNAHQVPVGRDQIQHIEMARDVASSFNYRYGEHFVMPQALMDDNSAILQGLDGRKMSKSYDNTIALFCTPSDLKKLIHSMLTDSKLPGEPKDADTSPLFQLYSAFSSESEAQEMRGAFSRGIAWGEAKSLVFEHINAEITPMRTKYEALIADRNALESLLQKGAQKARAIAEPFFKELKEAVGLRSLVQSAQAPAKIPEKESNEKEMLFKQYRESDGLFYFKVSKGNQVVIQSTGFDSPKEAAEVIRKLKEDQPSALIAFKNQLRLME